MRWRRLYALVLIVSSALLFHPALTHAAVLPGIEVRTEHSLVQFSEEDAVPIRWAVRPAPTDPTWRELIDTALLEQSPQRPFLLRYTDTSSKEDISLRYQLKLREETQENVTLVFRAETEEGFVVQKRFVLSQRGFRASLHIEVVNPAETPVLVGGGHQTLSLLLGPGLGLSPDRLGDQAEDGRDYHIAALGMSGSLVDELRKENTKLFSAEPISWAALVNYRSVVAIKPAGASAAAGLVTPVIEEFRGPGLSDESGSYYPSLRIDLRPLEVPARGSKTSSFDILMGPKTTAVFQDFDPTLSRVFYWNLWGWLAALCRPLEVLLRNLAEMVGSWGLALILFAVMIRAISLPLSLYSSRHQAAMKETMAIVRAKEKLLKEEFSDDANQRVEAIFALYREYNVGPRSQVKGCLALFFQLPFLIALFQVLLGSPDLLGQSFLWIEDLTLPDHLMELGFSLPWFGSYLNGLPFVMLSVQLGIARLLKPESSDDSSSEAPFLSLSDLAMPVTMTVLFYPFPSGAILYWTTTNSMQLLEHMWLRRENRRTDGT